MNYLEALRLLHAGVQPESYVEIGCWNGASLELAQCPRLAVDPEPEITGALTWPTRIFRETSDAFFTRADVAATLGQPFDLAFIDGMHLVEFALRDFINLEKHAAPGAVIVIDDVAPGDIAWATRKRETKAWTGDVYRIIPILRQYRPDLEIGVFEATILEFGKGIAVISNLDPGNRVLDQAYPEIEAAIARAEWLASSAQDVCEMLAIAPAEHYPAYIETICANRRYLPLPPKPDLDLTARYLELTKASVLNEIYLEDEFRLLYLRDCNEGKTDYDPAVFLDICGTQPDRYAAFEAAHYEGRPFQNDLDNLGFAQSMMGRLRMENLHHCLDHLRHNDIPGDVIECGVWRGGGCIFMAAYLTAHGMTDRRVLVADSFCGLPKPTHPKDGNLDLSQEKFPQLAIPRETVARGFESYGLLDDRVVFLEGWFSDTLADAPTDQIALLRLDGDLYESTMDILTALYDRVSPGAPVIVDDYGVIAACRMALEDFFAARDEPVPELTRIDWTGVYFMKPGAS